MKSCRVLPSRKLSRSLRVESLESRRLLAATVINSSAEEYSFPNIAFIVGTENQQFYARHTAEYGSELWVSESLDQPVPLTGVPQASADAGHSDTRLVVDLIPGTGGSNPRDLTAHGTRVYFTANVDATDSDDEEYSERQLWVSDGTATGTRRLTQFGGRAEGVAGVLSESTQDDDGPFATISKGLVFGVWTPSNKFQLWLQPFDDTSAFQLSSEAEGNMDVIFIRTTSNHVIFEQKSESGDSFLWVSDGTPAGTQLVSGYPTDLELSFHSEWSETEDGLTTILKNSVGLPYEIWQISASGTFSRLGGANADPNDPSSVPVSVVTESESSQLLEVGDSLWWSDFTAPEFHPVGDMIHMAPGIVQLSDAEGAAYWTIAPPAKGDGASPESASSLTRAIRRTDTVTRETRTTLLPDAVSGSELHVLGNHLIYESLSSGNRTLVAVDVDSGNVQTLEMLIDTDELSVDIVTSDTLIYRLERLDGSLLATLQASSDPGQPLVQQQLLNELLLPSQHRIFADHLFTYVPTDESFALTRVDVHTNAREVLLTGDRQDTHLIFDSVDALFNSVSVPFGDDAVIYQVRSPLGRDELWLFRDGQRSLVMRLPEDSLLSAFAGDRVSITTTDDQSVVYVSVRGTRSGVLQILQSSLETRIIESQFFESRSPTSMSIAGESLRFVSNSIIYQWDIGSVTPTPIDRHWDASMSIALSNGAALAVSPGTYLQSAVVEREGETELQTFIAAELDASSIFVYRLTDSWIARTIARDYVSQSWWIWADNELQPRSLDVLPDLPGTVRYDIIGKTPTHVLVRASDPDWATIDVFAINDFGVHSFRDAINGEINFKMVDFDGTIDGSPVLHSLSGDTFAQTTMQWDIENQTVYRLLRPVDDSQPQSVMAVGNQLLLTRPTQRLLVPRNDTEPSFHNPLLPEDVNSDGYVSALDALTIINWLNRNDPSANGETVAPRPSLLLPDVSGDDYITALDALMVINRLNGGFAFGEPDSHQSPQDSETQSMWFQQADASNDQQWNRVRRSNPYRLTVGQDGLF